MFVCLAGKCRIVLNKLLVLHVEIASDCLTEKLVPDRWNSVAKRFCSLLLMCVTIITAVILSNMIEFEFEYMHLNHIFTSLNPFPPIIFKALSCFFLLNDKCTCLSVRNVLLVMFQVFADLEPTES